MPESASDGGAGIVARAVTSESPLARFRLADRAAASASHARVLAGERAFLGHLNLRGNSDDPRFVSAVQSVLDGAPPVAPNTVADVRDATVYWLGPDEWLIVCPAERRAAIGAGMQAALADVRSAITDLTGGQTVIVLRGDPARDVLAKGCPLDLHPRAFDVGRCAQSHLAKAPILIRQVDREPSFEIVIRRSFADYLWTWLEDAAREYGFVVEP
jgi:sarcosine oxidase, subunit gamma